MSQICTACGLPFQPIQPRPPGSMCQICFNTYTMRPPLSSKQKVSCQDCGKWISKGNIWNHNVSGRMVAFYYPCYDKIITKQMRQSAQQSPHIHWSTQQNPNTWMPGGQIPRYRPGQYIPPNANSPGGQMPRQGQIGVRIWWDKDVQAYYISTPYNQNFVEFIKAAIPVGKRHWDPQTKIWMFSEEFLPALLKLCQNVWGLGNVTVIDKFQAEKASAPPAIQKTKMEDVLAGFMQLLPYDVALTAYRKAAMQLHPDRGGDAIKMSKLNTLWKRIQKELYQQ